MRKSQTSKVIGGVCGGIAENYGIDVTWVRLGFFALAFFTLGTGLLAYAAMWLVME
jgi:phage shock protein C